MKRIDVKKESINEILKQFLGYADVFSFVVREEYTGSHVIDELLSILSPYLKEKKIVDEWPGTKLLMGTATLYRYNLITETILILSSQNDSLFDWISPELPEDIVVYKGHIPIFVSITHECSAYLEISSLSMYLPTDILTIT